MAKSEVALAIDQLIKDVLVDPLKAAGFRRKGRRWTDEANRVHRTVEVQSSQRNSYPTGSFRVGLAARFTAIELETAHGQPYFAGFFTDLGSMGSESAQHWYDINLKAQKMMARTQRELTDDWVQRGQPLVEAMVAPGPLCDHLAATTTSVTCLLGGLSLAQHLEDGPRQITLVRRAADLAAAKTNWRAVDFPHPLEGGLSYWARIVEEFQRLELDLDASHVAAASAVVADAAAGMLSTPNHGEWEEDAAETVVDGIGESLPPMFRVRREDVNDRR